MAGSDITGEILKEIRDDVRGLRGGLDEFRGEVAQRFGTVEATLLDLAQQQRFIVRHTKALVERDSHLEARVAKLETK